MDGHVKYLWPESKLPDAWYNIRPNRLAPGTPHATKVVLDEANARKECGESRTILLNLAGHGNFDMRADDDFLAGRLQDDADPVAVAKVQEALSQLPKVGAH
jgi:tryptophan synthase beta chain